MIFREIQSPFALKTRNILFKRFRKYFKSKPLANKLDLTTLAYTFHDDLSTRVVDFGFTQGTDYSGSLIVDFDRKSDIDTYGCALFIDGTTLEFFGSRKDNRKIEIYFDGQLWALISEFESKKTIEWQIFLKEKLFGTIKTGDYLLLRKWLWFSKAIPNNAKMQTIEYGDLPVLIDRRSDTIFDFLNAVLKLTTLYGLWMPKWIKNDDPVIPAATPELSEEAMLLYFATNICFRCILFNSFFSSRSGD